MGNAMTDNTSASTPPTRKDVEAKIVALARKDDDFRQKFLADPKGQFEEKLGTKLPPSLKMTAHAEDENSLHFAIPMKPPQKLDELSDQDLEKVAGGTDVSIGTALFSVAQAVRADDFRR
jgi:hypothetical protein